VGGASAAEIRVLGCLLEKQRTTPEGYPLSINALRLACNQATNRDPVLDYDEGTVRAAAERLGHRRWARFTGGRGSRATKYRHVLGEELALAADELAVLCVLMLRGAQTPGELNARTARLHAFPDLVAVEEVLGRRYIQRLGEETPEAQGHLAAGEATVAPPDGGPATAPSRGPDEESPSGFEPRIERLEEEVRTLRAMVEDLRRELGA
jgi:uncharacterized protein YceH (UPF0502 family)